MWIKKEKKESQDKKMTIFIVEFVLSVHAKQRWITESSGREGIANSFYFFFTYSQYKWGWLKTHENELEEKKGGKLWGGDEINSLGR